MNKIIYLASIILFSFSLNAQNTDHFRFLTQQLQETSNDSVKTEMLIELSKLTRSQNLSESLSYARQAQKTAESTESPELMAIAHNNLGIIFYHIGEYDQALEHFLDSKRIYETNRNYNALIGQINNICGVLLQLEEYDKAWDLYQELFEKQNALLAKGDSSNLSQLHVFYNSMGIISEKRGELKKAQSYFEMAIENATKYDYKNRLASIYNSMAENYFEQKQTDNALQCLRLAIEFSEYFDDMIELSKAKQQLSKYFLDQNSYKEALANATESLSAATKAGSNVLKGDSYHLLYQIEEQKGNYLNALNHYKNYTSYQDSIFNEKTIKEITRLEMTHQFEKQEEQFKIQNSRIKFIYGIIILGLLLGLVIFVLYYLLNKSRDKGAYLTKQTLEKDLELRERELVMKELYLVEKNETLKKVTKQLSEVQLKADAVSNEIIAESISLLKSSLNKSVWEEFETRYQQVHEGFYEKLREQFSFLTPTEEKLSALLRLGMSSKEIAELTQQSVKSVEVARSRLRKKLNLTNTNVNLSTFLAQL
ncbi:tetratricopeptide repeat protein [Maribellus sp. CM-23]|uniref:tetratricopeptide repeat protein n=1 Tax=Maribellus sp. CM-23 TaxID=2781026 RepID=UPI001F2C2EC4|nr:tetratricopeptide repeat protein [Maribellus sp. CM-23]MCE4565270.1 tetratricopeptide repeat protein [Maribellus sp. CM-23]